MQQVYLGDTGLGYPASLYPNLTYVATNTVDPADSTTTETIVYATDDVVLSSNSHLLLGPLVVNTSYALLSITIPIMNNTSMIDILGYMT